MENSLLTKIKNELDIVDIVSEHVDLTKKGRNYWGLCPFHEDSNPSMSISPEKQLFKCFVCQAGGDLIKFNADINHISFVKSLEMLGKRIGIEINSKKYEGPKYSDEEQKFIDIHNDAMNYFQYSLTTEDGIAALEYTKKRNLTQSILEKFLIGYAPKHGLKEYLISKGHDEADIINSSLENTAGGDFFRDRLIFGIKNHKGDIVSFSGRDLSGNDQAKYINSAETALFSKSKILYNFSSAIESMKKNKEVFINEGFMDVIAMYRAGIRNSVAIMGTALTKNHSKFLKNYKVTLMLDGDKAGINATIKSIKILLNDGIKVYVIENKTGLDPDEIIEKNGVDGLIEFSNQKIEALEFIFNLHVKKFSNLGPEKITEFITSFEKYIHQQDEITKEFYIQKMAKHLNVSPSTIINNIDIREPFEPEEIMPSKKQQTITKHKTKNDAFKLLKSMLHNKNLVKIYEENKPYLIEPLLITIGNCFVEKFHNKEAKLDNEEFSKIQEIELYKEYVNTPEEFKELLWRVSKESYEWEMEANNVKLNSINDEVEKLRLVEKNVILKKELNKH